MSFTDEKLELWKHNLESSLKLNGEFAYTIEVDRQKLQALIARLEAAEKALERMNDTHYEDCDELNGGNCDCGTDEAMGAWRKSKGTPAHE